jgi:putative hydrolase of the HAD superfamily
LGTFVKQPTTVSFNPVLARSQQLGARSLFAQTLLIDADDTLWENNIYFERAIARFISFLNHHEFSPGQVREVLNDVERECIVKHGYGLHSFSHALVDTFERLSPEPITPELHAQVLSFGRSIENHAIEFLPEVLETLQYLSSRHRLILVTKGAIEEQTGKIERSGVRAYFGAAEVVSEKNAPVYKRIVEHYQLDPASTWMIGNSPKSDINPALAAGLHAVFVPHGDTWILEHEELNSAPLQQKLLIVGGFAELREHF